MGGGGGGHPLTETVMLTRVVAYCRIRDVLAADQFMHLEIQENFFKEFPDTIRSDQTVAVWKHMVFYQRKWDNIKT